MQSKTLLPSRLGRSGHFKQCKPLIIKKVCRPETGEKSPTVHVNDSSSIFAEMQSSLGILLNNKVCWTFFEIERFVDRTVTLTPGSS